MYIPTVKIISREGIESEDLITYSFLKDRDIFISEEITDDIVPIVIAQLKYLDKNGKGDIHIWINSPGGSATAGMAIYDAMKRCHNDCTTICTGMAASIGVFLLAAGTKGKRMATPEAEIMIHQPLGGAQGQASDIDLVAQHIVKTKKRLNTILSEATGKSLEEIARDTDRDYFMLAGEAKEYGIIDKILTI